MGQIIPDYNIQFAKDASPDTRNYRVNCDRLPEVLPSFKPQWDARRGAKELYNAFKKNRITLEDFEGPKYQRIGHIHKLIDEGIIDENLRFKKNGLS